MEYRIFCDDLKAEVERVMGPDYDVRFESVLKNNHVKYDALVIMKRGEHIAPTVCLNGYYDEYNKGQKISDIAQSLIAWYEQHKGQLTIVPEVFYDYDNIRDNIFVKVINAKMNETLLKRLPHICYYDLAMIAYWEVEHEGARRGVANITNGQLEVWNIDKQRLFSDAVTNTKKKNAPKLESLSDMMKELLAARLDMASYKVGEDGEMDISLARVMDDIDAMDDQKIYVLTNEQKVDGAVYMLFDDVLESISIQLGTDFCIIPSSVHEVLLVPKDDTIDYEYLQEMVVSVNESYVEPEEVLSENVYVYERGKGILWEE